MRKSTAFMLWLVGLLAAPLGRAGLWLDDALPSSAGGGATGGDSWNWLTSSPSPHSGTRARQSSVGAGLLSAQKDLTPESLIRYFSDFTFELRKQVQDPETFLQRKRGDCDDFARLASTLLSQRGYQTKLVVIMMEKQTHVVCYVKEAHGFLDFNHRADRNPVIDSDGSLEDIAQNVAAFFRSQWRMVSEFRYENSTPVYLDSVFAPGVATSRPVQSVPAPFAANENKPAVQAAMERPESSPAR